jgi:tetratricopeptide (TPR) repeat protein
VPDWQIHRLKESALHEIEAALAQRPELVQLHFERARLLASMGRLQEAKQVYLDILIRDPNQFAAFNNLGVILNELGYRKEALQVYREVVRRFPDNPPGILNLARLLYKLNELSEARVQYENVLRLVPDHVGAHQGLSCLLTELQEEGAALEHGRKGFGVQPWTNSAYRGEREPIRILLLVSPRGANSPLQRFLDDNTFLISEIVPDYYTSSVPLPPHQLVINAISEADRCGASLDAAERMLNQTNAPVLNLPAKIRFTSRVEGARILGTLDGVVTPLVVALSRTILTSNDAISIIRENGFDFPLLLRTPGFHGGDHFRLVENPEGLLPAVALLPGQELAVIQYLDARQPDGKIRKYRVMIVDGKLYPLHKAVSSQWKIHYFSAEMADSVEHRDEDAAFLEDMPSVLGERAMRALEQVRDTLALDYAGIDFSLSSEDVLLFEANATMAVPDPDKGNQWDYRRGPVERIHAAIREMILHRAKVSLV